MKLLDKVKANAKKIAVGAVGGAVAVPAMANTYNVTEIVAEFDKGEAPVAAVASASIELFVIRRIWKIIRSSI